MKTNLAKLSKNENTADFGKKLYDLNRLSMCTQDTQISKKTKVLPPTLLDSTLQDGINSSNINRQNFDGQSKFGNHVKALHANSFKENRHSLGATSHSIASTQNTLSRAVSQFTADGRPNLKLLDQSNLTAFDKIGSCHQPQIVQLPLPATDHKKEQEIASKLLKAKSFNDSKLKFIGSHLTEKRTLERQNSTANDSSRFQIGESISSSETGENPFTLLDHHSEHSLFQSYE